MNGENATNSDTPNDENIKEDVPTNGIKVMEKKVLIELDVGIQVVDHIKAPPESVLSLKKEAMTTEELSRSLLSPSLVKEIYGNDQQDDTRVPINSQSSTLLTDSSGSRREKLPAMNESMLNMNKSRPSQSRQGRTHQRWEIDPVTNQKIRLVTGCVPILGDGRIMFVSANRKPEWILPKGGWERDEIMGESAIREAFEEAGVLGYLGPKLSAVQYETRKSKKRRQENEEMQRMMSTTSDNLGNKDSKLPTSTASSPSKEKRSLEQGSISKEKVTFTESESLLPDVVVERIRGSNLNRRADDASSIASDSSSLYSLVKMTLFPLYVTSIQDTWPESGRFRKCLHIDEGIKMLSSREEFRSVLLEVKRKQLHLVQRNSSDLK